MTIPPPGVGKSQGIRPLTYDNPLVAVFLRTLAWERYVAKRRLQVSEVVTEQVQIARQELGLPLLGSRKTSGAADDFVQRLRRQGLVSAKGTQPEPLDPLWEKEWRLQYLPSHAQVRQLSYAPVVGRLATPSTSGSLTHILLTLRDPAMPRVNIWIGDNSAVSYAAAKRRGVYVLRSTNDIYLGKSDEFETRLRQHLTKRPSKPTWCVFFSPEDEGAFTLDSLGAAEGLLISFWNEICLVNNKNRGSDRQPAPTFLQQAILFTASVSAALLWFARDEGLPGKDTLPFKKFQNKIWPECYLKVPGR